MKKMINRVINYSETLPGIIQRAVLYALSFLTCGGLIKIIIIIFPSIQHHFGKAPDFICNLGILFLILSILFHSIWKIKILKSKPEV